MGAYSWTGPWSRGGLDPFKILTVVVLVTDQRTLTMRPSEGK
jgi:hypothetical protein